MKRNEILGIFLFVWLLLSGVVSRAEIIEGSDSGVVYNIHRVGQHDHLNLRAGPGMESIIIKKIPPDAKGVVDLGEKKYIATSVWRKVRWMGNEGWVNAYYLIKKSGPVVPTVGVGTDRDVSADPEVVMQCDGVNPSWLIYIRESEMDVELVGGVRYQVPVEFRKASTNNHGVAVVAGRRGNAFTSLVLRKENVCNLPEESKNYTYSITGLLNGYHVVSGCCLITGG